MLCVKSKELPTLNSVSSKMILQSVASRPALQEMFKEEMFRKKENDVEQKLGST